MSALLHLRFYLYRHARVLALGLVCVLCSNGAALLGPLVLQRAIDSLSPGSGSHGHGLLLWRDALIIAVVALVGAVFSFGARWTINGASRRVEYEMRNNLFQHFQRLDLGFFQQNRVGDLVARATNDLSAVRMMLGPGVSQLCNTSVAFVLTMAAMAVLDWRLTLMAGVFLIAHRLSTIRDVDRIIVLHKERIAEQGTHDELINSGGVYRNLYELQYQTAGPGVTGDT